MSARSMLIAYAALTLFALLGLIWALNEHIEQVLCCPGGSIPS